MRRRLVGLSMAAMVAGAAIARPQEQAKPQPRAPDEVTVPSLADVARKVRAERAKGQLKPVKVFTNADLPTGPGGVSIVGGIAPEEARSEPGMEPAAEPEGEHGERYYARAMGKLQAKLDLHRRELAVLQQKLNLAEPQYYADPSRALDEQYSRAEINQLTHVIEEKTAQVSGDEQAVRDLGEQLRQEGGDPGWLRADAVAAARRRAESEEQAAPAGAPGAKALAATREYWQSRFKSARARLKDAEEERQLAEDELSLLKTRQVNESAAQSELMPEISVKQADVEIKQAAAAKAKDALAALEKEFKESGAPGEWITDTE